MTSMVRAMPWILLYARLTATAGLQARSSRYTTSPSTSSDDAGLKRFLGGTPPSWPEHALSHALYVLDTAGRLTGCGPTPCPSSLCREVRGWQVPLPAARLSRAQPLPRMQRRGG
eukprot:CAMPEP_0206250814 /NCGR_PEP_ID=MMETSP0047_2-20121206/21682_1 /ASSEMBLY_ACC=CAM_ASM_000192 /TAXON_ID=195065 /ORGANISM="Chroomonas mesostigmatica_cf, Strain CCMP1168" /LENGTH=114 /DNA_ID=CAMNT_0053676707 /DNA_START=192 /DNA_END=533 /DNA_ORIENTATION=-